MLRKDALLRCHFGRSKSEVHRTSCSLAEMKYMLRIPLGRERVASDSFLFFTYSVSDSHMLCQVLAYHNGMGDILQFVFGTDA